MQFPTKFDTYIVIPHEFNAIRVINSFLSPTSIDLLISASPVLADNLTEKEINNKAGLGFQKIQAWVDLVLDSLVVINSKAEILPYLEDYSENAIMYAPGEPDDYLLSCLLHAKLSAIVKDYININEISLTTSDTGGIQRCYKSNGAEYPLPDISYLGEGAAHNNPWWMRDSLDVVDYPLSKIKDLSELTAMLEEGNEAFNATFRDGADYRADEAEIVTVDLWRRSKK